MKDVCFLLLSIVGAYYIADTGVLLLSSKKTNMVYRIVSCFWLVLMAFLVIWLFHGDRRGFAAIVLFAMSSLHREFVRLVLAD